MSRTPSLVRPEFEATNTVVSDRSYSRAWVAASVRITSRGTRRSASATTRLAGKIRLDPSPVSSTSGRSTRAAKAVIRSGSSRRTTSGV